MKYKELIEFDPIESVVQLKDANKAESARKLAASYIISPDMAKRINEQVIRNLQFKKQVDNKALLIVGNYGSGKSHLMSVISAIAEYDGLLDLPNLAFIKDAAKDIAGEFKVIRVDIGASKKPLRDIIIDELSTQLKSMRVEYNFPSEDAIANHRSAFEDMMTLFDKEFPGKGLLFVVDELLDYLRRLNDNEIIGALGILREIGEISRDSKFRFMTGVQEAVFDSQRFTFESDALRRVKDRFEQISIIREDIKFVVAQRLLKKTTEQKAKIRDYLAPFAKYYGNLNENMDEFVNLFPVHPDYIDTFERVATSEKRQALQSLSIAMRDILGNDVPSEFPGVIAFDFYWSKLKADPSFRTDDEVKQVLDCSEVLENRINNAFARPQYKDMAIRIIHALSIHRFTVGDLQSPLGMTSEELRDRLFLFEPNIAEMGGEADKDLLTHVDVVLKEIDKTLSGQFISFNRDNNQCYIDINKRVDYDAKIEARAESLGPQQLDKAYYQILLQAMECRDETPHASGYQIWLHELIWQDRQAARSGYLFFGTPNERSTAVPRRDYYIYFIQPEQPPKFRDEKKPEEVFLLFKKSDDEEFRSLLKNYTAAFELASTSSGPTKNAYEEKQKSFFNSLSRWLQEHLMEAFSLMYGGRKMPISKWSENISIRDLSGVSRDETVNFRDTINRICEYCLADYFESEAPNYPIFTNFVSATSRSQAAQDALRGIISSDKRTRQAKIILDALKLLDGDKLLPSESPYANYIIEKLQKKGQGQVLNRDELINKLHTIEYMDIGNSRLEPEWIAVVLGALVYSGDIILSVTGNKFDATAWDSLITTDIHDLINFKHIEAPKDWNTSSLKALFSLLGLPENQLADLQQKGDDTIKKMRVQVEKLIEAILNAQRILDSGLSFWGGTILPQEDIEVHSKNLKAAKEFFESMQNYKVPGQLKNFNQNPADIKTHEKALQSIKDLESLNRFISIYQNMAQWFSVAEQALPADHDLVDRIKQSKAQISEISQGGGDIRNKFSIIDRDLKKLKKDYINAYAVLHTKARLNLEQDGLKNKLLNQDSRLKTLRDLRTIELMPQSQLSAHEEELASLLCCSDFTEKDLEDTPICPRCNYNPIAYTDNLPASQRLQNLDDRLDVMLSAWQTTLLDNLSDPTVQASMGLLKAEEKSALDSFMAAKTLPDSLPEDLISALRQVMQGLDRITMEPTSLLKTLQGDDAAVSLSELKERFEKYIDGLTRGKDIDKIRIVIERGNDD